MASRATHSSADVALFRLHASRTRTATGHRRGPTTARARTRSPIRDAARPRRCAPSGVRRQYGPVLEPTPGPQPAWRRYIVIPHPDDEFSA